MPKEKIILALTLSHGNMVTSKDNDHLGTLAMRKFSVTMFAPNNTVDRAEMWDYSPNDRELFCKRIARNLLNGFSVTILGSPSHKIEFFKGGQEDQYFVFIDSDISEFTMNKKEDLANLAGTKAIQPLFESFINQMMLEEKNLKKS